MMKKLISLCIMLIMIGLVSYPTFAKQIGNITLIGDANMDNDVNILDATTIQRYVASLISKEDISFDNADVDDNSFVNIIDATIIQKYKVQIIQSLPYCNIESETESTYETENLSYEDIEYEKDGIKYKDIWNEKGFYDKYQWIIDKEEHILYKSKYDSICHCICNICGADVSGNEEGKVGDFDPEYADMYFPQYHYHVQHCASSWHTEVELIFVGYDEIFVPEKGHWELIQE